MNFRRTVYLVVMSSVDYNETAHKLLKLLIREEHQVELCQMILECCMQERTYARFYGLLAQKFCEVRDCYPAKFGEVFRNNYETIHRHEVNKIRNAAKMFAHLLYSDAIPYDCFEVLRVTEEDTTSAGRIFIKILFQEIAENLGVDSFVKKLTQDDAK